MMRVMPYGTSANYTLLYRMFWAIIYVVLWVLMVLAAFAPDSYPQAPKARWIISLILFGIIGYVLFHGQVH